MLRSLLLASAAVSFMVVSAIHANAADDKSDEKWDVTNPPGEKRDIRINVTEGTWMSLDVSPDGNTIAFDLLGDIYTLPVTGGTATNIAPGMAYDSLTQLS